MSRRQIDKFTPSLLQSMGAIAAERLRFQSISVAEWALNRFPETYASEIASSRSGWLRKVAWRHCSI